MSHIPEALLAIGKITTEACDVSVGVREHLSVPAHTHPSTNHVLVAEGVLYLTLDGVERAVHAGQWCCIPAQAEHAERFVEKTSVIVFWVKK